MEHQLPQLPFALDALAPHMSKETLEYHYGKHHQAYVTNLNNLIKGTEYESLALEAIVKKAPAGGIFNIWWDCRAGGAQVYDLYFNRCHLGVKNSSGHTGIARCLLFQPAPSAHDDSGPSLGGGSVVTLKKLNKNFKWSQVDHGCYNIDFTDTLFELPIAGSSIGKGVVLIDACDWARNYSTWMGSDSGASDLGAKIGWGNPPGSRWITIPSQMWLDGLIFTRCFKKGGSVIGELGRNCSSVDSNFGIWHSGLFDNETVGSFAWHSPSPIFSAPWGSGYTPSPFD